MQNLYLSHHGILGQKWGVRRYQNKDGTLTEAGRGRRSKSAKQRDKEMSEMSNDELRKANNRKNLERQYKQSNPVRSESFNRETVNQVRSDATATVSGLSKLLPHKRTDLSQYSDKELQNIINRQRLEQQYHQMNPDVIETGASFVNEVLQTAGAAAGLYLTYKKIKKVGG